MQRTIALLLVALVALAAPLLAEEFEREFDTDARQLVVRNLVGEVTVTAAAGDRYEMVVHVRGDDASPDLIQVNLEDGRAAELVVAFPIEEHDDYVYPPLGRGKTTIHQPSGDTEASWLQRLTDALTGDKVTIRGSGRGLEAWADIELRVPEGRETEVYLGAGELSSDGVAGRLVLDTHSGPVRAERHRGELVCDTGSGSVVVEDMDGPLLADTGSGSVEVRNQRGGSLKVDTGSGGVVIDGADTDDLYVDTGSGGVSCRGVKADEAEIDTGSGSVALELLRMGTGRFVIDTGSGGVELTIPRDASATISVDTGSGGVRHDVPDAEVLHEGDGELKLRVGDGEARVVVDTGSGGVKITAR